MRFFNDVFNEGDIATVDDIFAKDYVGYSSANLGRPIVGQDGIKEFVKKYRQAFPDIHFDFEDVITHDDKVVVRWTTRGTHQRDLFNIAPTGKTMTVTGIGIAQVVDAQIKISHSEVNMLSLVQQLGVVPELR